MKNLESFIKEYSTRDFLYALSTVSIMMFKKQLADPNMEFSCCMSIPINAIMFGFLHKKVNVMLSAWEIHKMQYLSILHSNDYRKKTLKQDEVGILVNLYRGYDDENSDNEYLKTASIEDVYKFMMGMTYEQFKYQNVAWTLQNFNRNYHILIGSDRIRHKNVLAVNSITEEIFGMNADELIVVELMILWLCSQHPDPLGAPEELYHKTDTSILTKENIMKVITYYSVTYEEVRESKIAQQIFYSKPFIHTKKSNEYVASNLYLVLMLMADGIYWLIRDYYFQHDGSQKFVNAFGEMFEDYFEELAETYLPSGTWSKIPQGKKKGADYQVELDKAVLIFEQKSGILGIGAKQQNPNIQEIDKFYDRNIRKAYQQLINSEKEYHGDKPVLKIFLLYENLTNTQIIMSSIPEIFDVDSNCFIMTIADLEMLFATYKSDYTKFSEVIDCLIKNENDANEYKSVLEVLNKKQAIGNLHFVGDKDYFNNILKKLKIEYGE